MSPEPTRAPKGLAFAEIQARQLTLQWEPLGYNVTRCHTYAVSLCYHYTLGGSHNQTIRECVKMERGASRYTIKNLLPFRNVHVRLILTNPEGRKEGKEVTFQTDEDGKSAGQIPGVPSVPRPRANARIHVGDSSKAVVTITHSWRDYGSLVRVISSLKVWKTSAANLDQEFTPRQGF